MDPGTLLRKVEGAMSESKKWNSEGKLWDCILKKSFKKGNVGKDGHG